MSKLLKNRKIKIKFSLASLFATWFYIGAIPFAQGTIASISTYPIYIFCLRGSSSHGEMVFSFGIIALVLFIIGLYFVDKYMRMHSVGDHSSIVIDEIVGQLVAFSVANNFFYKLSVKIFSTNKLMHYETGAFLIGFILFRYFDIKKPLFIKWFDKNLKGAFGVLFDDVLAGLAAGGCAWLIYSILNLRLF